MFEHFRWTDDLSFEDYRNKKGLVMNDVNQLVEQAPSLDEIAKLPQVGEPGAIYTQTQDQVGDETVPA